MGYIYINTKKKTKNVLYKITNKYALLNNWHSDFYGALLKSNE